MTGMARPHTRRECGCGFRRCGRGGVVGDAPGGAAARPRVPSASHGVRCRRHVPGHRPRDLAITPDGSRLIYVGNGGTQLFIRALDALEPVAVFTGEPSASVRLARWTVDRVLRRQLVEESGDHGRANSIPGGRREQQPFSRRDMGTQ